MERDNLSPPALVKAILDATRTCDWALAQDYQQQLIQHLSAPETLSSLDTEAIQTMQQMLTEAVGFAAPLRDNMARLLAGLKTKSQSDDAAQ